MSDVHKNPFITDRVNNSGAIDADSRRQMVRTFTVDQCDRALKVPGLQKTVREAIHARRKAAAK